MKNKKTLKIGFLVVLFAVVFVGGYVITNKVNGTSPYVDETAQLVKENPDDVVNRLEAKEQGMYYFGFPTCPWCVELLPVLDKELQADHSKAYTVDVRGEQYSDADNAIVKKFSQTYTKEDKLYVPFVVAINSSGEVKVHVGTVDDHDATKDKMTKDQEQRLVKILDKMIAFSQS